MHSETDPIVLTVILSWLQNDGTRGFTLALKKTRASGRNVGKSCFPLSWSIKNPLVPSNIHMYMYMYIPVGKECTLLPVLHVISYISVCTCVHEYKCI